MDQKLLHRKFKLHCACKHYNSMDKLAFKHVLYLGWIGIWNVGFSEGRYCKPGHQKKNPQSKATTKNLDWR